MQTGEDHFFGKKHKAVFCNANLEPEALVYILELWIWQDFCSCFLHTSRLKDSQVWFISPIAPLHANYIQTMLKWGYSWGGPPCACVWKVLKTYWKHIETHFWLSLPVHIWSSTSVLAAYEIVFQSGRRWSPFSEQWTGSKDSSLLNARPQRCLGICP